MLKFPDTGNKHKIQDRRLRWGEAGSEDPRSRYGLVGIGIFLN